MAGESAAWTWKDVVARLRDEPIDTVVHLAVTAIEEPASAGLHPMPMGADGRPSFGALVDEQTGVIVQVAVDKYEARLCRIPQLAGFTSSPPPPPLSPHAESSPPSPSPALRQTANLAPPPSPLPVLVETRAELVVARRHEPRSLARLPAEEPGATMLLTTLLGTAIGAALGGAKGALTGAIVGGSTGLASIAVSTAVTSPATSLTAQTMFLALASASLGGSSGGRVLRLPPTRAGALPSHPDDDEPPKRRLPRRR